MYCARMTSLSFCMPPCTVFSMIFFTSYIWCTGSESIAPLLDSEAFRCRNSFESALYGIIFHNGPQCLHTHSFNSDLGDNLSKVYLWLIPAGYSFVSSNMSLALPSRNWYLAMSENIFQ